MAEKSKATRSASAKGRRKPSSSKRKATRSRSRGKGSATTGTGLLESVLEVFLFAFCILLLISCFGNGGYVGNAISALEYGAFGVLAPLFPILLFLFILLLWVSKKKGQFLKRALAGFLLFVCLCAVVQFMTEGYIESFSLRDYYARSADYHVGGGLFGGGMCLSLCAAFGRIGGILLCLLLMFCCLILLTQPSFITTISSLIEGIGLPISSRLEDDEDDLYEKELRQELREQAVMRRKMKRVERLEKKLEREKERLALSGEEEGAFPSKKSQQRSASPLKSLQRGGKAAELNLEEEDLSEERGRKADTLEIHGLPTEELPFEEDQGWEKEGKEKRKKRGKRSGKAEEESLFEELDDPYEDSSDLGIFQATKVKKSQERDKGSAGFSQEEEIQERQVSPKGASPRGAQESPEEGFIVPEKPAKPRPPYKPPSIELLAKGGGKVIGQSREELSQVANRLEQILQDFGVEVTVTDVSCGPTVTRYELSPEPGVKVSKIVNLTDDIKLNLAAPDIRIEAPIPGKAAVGIEVPNKEPSQVMLRDLISSQEFKNAKSKISFAVGKDIGGKPIVTDIAKMPHLLIAGATGSGKSVCINTLIVSILYKASPDEVQLIMIDPKVVELSVYNGIPHLLIPVVTDPKKASGALNWGVAEMTRRYNTFAEYGVRNIGEYNRKIEQSQGAEEAAQGKMSQIVIIVDELADLMMVAPGEVEEAICRLAQLARAAGIHLVIATQRPSVNVITGLIKANMPSRIAFAVSSGVDSRTILDTYGAEKLLGKGDMLFAPQGYPKPARLQGAFVSDEEISEIVKYLSQFSEVTYDKDVQQQVETASASIGASQEGAKDERDQFFTEAALAIIDKDKASIGMLQRLFKIGFNRAARIMDQLAEAGVVGPDEGTKARKVVMSREEFQNRFGVS